MGALKETRKSLILIACSFIAVMTGMFLYDGATGETLALTTADCRACHDAAGWTRPYGGTVAIHHAHLPRACSACHKTTTPSTIDPTHPDYQCANCHKVGTTVYNALTVTAAHTPLHDKTNVPDPVTCNISCHLPDVIPEHDKYPQFTAPSKEMDCDRCHKNTNTDPALGPINVQQTIAKGSGPNGQVVVCTECHTMIGGQGHAAAHDEYMADSTSCNAVGCHDLNIMVEHVDNRGWSCNTCHLGETLSLDPAVVLQVVADAIAASPNPMDMNCSSCHGAGAGMHEAAHDQGFFLMTPPGQDCTRCHAAMDPLVDPNWANLVKEHVTNRGYTCATCHDQQVVDLDPIDVFNAIDKGRDPSNMPVYCIDCHTDAITGQGEGHAPMRPDAEPWNRCGICHFINTYGIPLHNMHEQFAYDIQQDCSVCHVPEASRPNCILCHSLDQTIWDPLPPHQETPVNASLNIIGPGTEDHDKHTAPGGPLENHCNYCHVSGVPGSEPLPVPYSECSNCHDGGLATDIGYGSTVHTVNHIQGAEAMGQGCSYCHSPAPACTDCHDIAGPTKPQHDFHTDAPRQIDCAECHTDGVPGGTPIPPPYNECSNCHDGTNGTDNIMYGFPGHDTHMTEANFNCSICHTEQPDCTSCHAVVHHETEAARQGRCDNCHSDPRQAAMQPTTYLPKQFGCDICHVKIAPVDATNSTLTIMAYDPIRPTGRPDGITKHAVTTANGYGNDHVFIVERGAVIQNYGACFNCHKKRSDGNPLPFHGHYAVNWPADNYTDPFDDRPGIPPDMTKPSDKNAPFGSNAQWAPGRGIFNVFEAARRWPNHFYNNNNSNPEDNVSRGNQYNQDVEGFYGPPSIEFSFAPVNWKNDSGKQYWVPNFDVVRGMATPSDSVIITRVEHDAGDSGGGGGGGGGNNSATPWATLSVEGTCKPRANLTAVLYGGKPYKIGPCSSKGSFQFTINLPVQDGYNLTDKTVWRTYFEEGAVWVVSDGQGYDWYYGGTVSNWDGCWADGYRWNNATLSYIYDPATCK